MKRSGDMRLIPILGLLLVIIVFLANLVNVRMSAQNDAALSKTIVYVNNCSSETSSADRRSAEEVNAKKPEEAKPLNTVTTPASMQPDDLNSVYLRHWEAVQQGCGDICKNEGEGITVQPGPFFDYITKPKFDCDQICSNAAIDAGSKEYSAPRKIPPFLEPFYTYNGAVPIRQYHAGILDQHYLGGKAELAVWEKEKVEDWVNQARQRKLEGNYGSGETNFLMDGLAQAKVQGANVLVIGSEIPWVEAAILVYEPKHVTTLEYGEILSKHPTISTMTPDHLRGKYKDYLNSFDVVVTFSSVEHSGLGRYGDAMNPYGDRQAIARAWCLAKPGARLVIAVMTGADVIEFNAHRIYGPKMWSHLVANWKQVWRANGGGQIVHVLQKPEKFP